jgi:hypothetical protein
MSQILESPSRSHVLDLALRYSAQLTAAHCAAVIERLDRKLTSEKARKLRTDTRLKSLLVSRVLPQLPEMEVYEVIRVFCALARLGVEQAMLSRFVPVLIRHSAWNIEQVMLVLSACAEGHFGDARLVQVLLQQIGDGQALNSGELARLIAAVAELDRDTALVDEYTDVLVERIKQQPETGNHAMLS